MAKNALDSGFDRDKSRQKKVRFRRNLYHCFGGQGTWVERRERSALVAVIVHRLIDERLLLHMLARLKVEEGDTLYAIETKEGYLLTSYDLAIADQLEAGREFMQKYRDTFKALAK